MRGETERVAERVRELLDPDRVPVSPPTPDDEFVVDRSGGPGPAAHRSPALLDRLAARLPVRLDPGRRAAVGVGVAVLIVAVLVGFWLWASGPRTADVGSPSAAATPTAGAGTPRGSSAPSTGPAAGGGPTTGAATRSASTLVVDVAGKVARPGLYHLAPGARVADALAAAGGARRGVDLTSINLAAPLTDGQQILVGVAGAVGQSAAVPPTGTPSVGPGGTSGPVNLNSATLEQLETLPGIGPALGQRILDYRAAHGSFSAVGQLNDVAGIGDVRFAQLAPLVTV